MQKAALESLTPLAIPARHHDFNHKTFLGKGLLKEPGANRNLSRLSRFTNKSDLNQDLQSSIMT